MWVHIKTVQNEDFVVTFWLDVLIFFGVTIWETEIVYVLRIPQLLHPKHPIIATWKDRIQNGRRIGKDDWTIACDTLRKCHWSQTSENLIEDEKTIIREWSLIRQNIATHCACTLSLETFAISPTFLFRQGRCCLNVSLVGWLFHGLGIISAAICESIVVAESSGRQFTFQLGKWTTIRVLIELKIGRHLLVPKLYTTKKKTTTFHCCFSQQSFDCGLWEINSCSLMK